MKSATDAAAAAFAVFFSLKFVPHNRRFFCYTTGIKPVG